MPVHLLNFEGYKRVDLMHQSQANVLAKPSLNFLKSPNMEFETGGSPGAVARPFHFTAARAGVTRAPLPAPFRLRRFHFPGIAADLAFVAVQDSVDELEGLHRAELLGHLDKKGIAENTLVVYVTDNGWIQQEGNPQYRLDSKQSPYDGGLRTPIMLRHTGKIKPQMIDTPVSSIDIAPTIYKFCNLSVPEDLKGIDLLDANAVKMRDAAGRDGAVDRLEFGGAEQGQGLLAGRAAEDVEQFAVHGAGVRTVSKGLE